MDSNSSKSPTTLSPTDTHKDFSIGSGESEYDETLGVPASLSVINNAGSRNLDDADGETSQGITSDQFIPYKSIYNKPINFKSVQRKVFIPGVEVEVKITGYERNATGNLLNPNLYAITLTHGDFSWIIHKRYKHFSSLHQQLVLYRATLNIPFPTKSHRESRQVVRMNSQQDTNVVTVRTSKLRQMSNRMAVRSPVLPRFPKKPEVLVSYDDLPNRMKALENYLHSLCNITIYRNHHELVDFLSVSNISFIRKLGSQVKEGMVLKKAGSSLPGQTGCDCCGLLQYGICNRCSLLCSSISCGRWRKRWFFVKDSCFGYITPSNGKIKSVMLFDQGFEVSRGIYTTGINNGLQILNLNRQLVMKLWTKRKSKDWISHLKDVANNQARDFTTPNPHHSFVPMRSNVTASSFIDGGGYLSTVADFLDAAKEDIFITDWWLSPEIYMKRPITGDYWRLDKILKRKAAMGVKVFIMLYKEVEMALGINSFYSKSQLNDDNIKVIRHPDHAKAGVFLWAHHEKLVVVDQAVAFVGGIDLCYGRWDDHCHRLTDLGVISKEESDLPKTKTKKYTSSSPGGETYVHMSRSMSIPNVPAEAETPEENGQTQESEIVEKKTAPIVEGKNLPVLQPGDHLLMPPSIDPNTVYLKDHYNPNLISRPSFLGKRFKDLIGGNSPDSAAIAEDDKEKKKAERYAASTRNLFFPEQRGEEGQPMSRELSRIPEEESALSYNDISIPQESLDDQSKLWLGKDYANFIVKDFTNLNLPFDDLVDRSSTPRMPWHDIATMVQGEAARDVARHFIQRWNAHKFEKYKKNDTYPYLLPKSYSDIAIPNIGENLEKNYVSCQILRSLSCWSGGFVDPDSNEQSIHEAYVESITRAQHYVYIENQFFITLSRHSVVVTNQIGEALFNRIMRAHKSNSIFRVFVVMPLLPAFEGEVGGVTGTSLHAITHWNYQSISRGDESLYVRLKKAGVKDPTKYITFHGLRTHSTLDDEPVTELIYVHSKLMIVDDRLVICGSANINDRSMLGCRDSEVAVLIQDEAFEEGFMNGETFPSGGFAGSLRKRLFREHLGLIGRRDLQRKINLKDPISDTFYNGIWLATSRKNTAIFEKVFHCIPTDSVKSFSELKKYQEEHKDSMWDINPTAATRELEGVQGHLVDFPLEFLVNETLTPPSASMIGIMPTVLWT